MGGPSWIGIGAPRCGTTLFTQVAAAHPDVALAAGAKELHYFDRYVVDAFSAADAERYRALFDPARRGGEFTPAYLRSLWVPDLVLGTCGAEVVLVVLLRDPVDRFRSHMNWAFRRRPPGGDDETARRQWARQAGNMALWSGMYATQLAAWSAVFPRERFLVLQYERFVRDPDAELAPFWRAIGVAARPASVPKEPTWNSTGGAHWTEPEGLVARLRTAYAPQVDGVAAAWGVDRALWPNFA